MQQRAEGVITRHLTWMEVKNLSPLTITGRRCALERLARHLNGPILYATPDDLYGWQVQRTRELKPATRRTELSNVREFYRWACREGYIDRDPTIRLEMPRAPRRLPRPIRDDKLARAMHLADPRMRAILGLAGLAGLRAKEIAGLDWSEIDLDGREPMLIVVHGKGDRSRRVPLSPLLVDILGALPHRHGPVICRYDHLAGNITPNSVSKRASTHLRACGLTERLHAGRHRFATAAYQGTLDLRAVQELMGHASPTTTSVYAAASSSAAREAVDAAGKLAA